jgi:capsular polysaccharide biosynthesis protein
MKGKDLKPLRVSLHGMDKRVKKMMVTYFKLPCKGAAIVVDDKAHIEIVDVDLSPSKSLLEERLAQQPSKPIIALSLNEISISGVIHVKKPVETPDILAAFAVAKDVILGNTSLERTSKPTGTPPKTSETRDKPKVPSKPNKPKPQLKSPKNATTHAADAADAIELALEKSKATQKQTNQQDILHKKVALDDTEQQPKIVLSPKKLDLRDLQNTPRIKDAVPIQTAKKSQAPLEIGIGSLTPPKPESAKEKPEITQAAPETNFSEEVTIQDEIVQPNATPEFLKPNEPPVKLAPANDIRETAKPVEKTAQPSSKSEKKSSQYQFQFVALKHPNAPNKPISTDEPSVSTPRSTELAPAHQLVTADSSGSFIDLLWHRKGFITGLTCLFALIPIIYIVQMTSMYETRARIFISANIENSTPPEETLDKSVAQKKMDEIASRKIAWRVIKALQLNTIPEFDAASAGSGTQASTSNSKLRLERQTADQTSLIADYFLQNLNVTQFKNSPIINIDYKAEDPKLATKIVNQLVEEYIAMQQEKKSEVARQLIDWETNKLPATRDQVEQSQNALELYVEMNKWSQFEQQFAEDMGVNSEIRVLEKKLKADIDLYDILVERFEKFKENQHTDSMEAKLISSAEQPLSPSYPNRLRLFLSTLLSAALIAMLVTYILSVLNFGGKKVMGESM